MSIGLETIENSIKTLSRSSEDFCRVLRVLWRFSASILENFTQSYMFHDSDHFPTFIPNLFLLVCFRLLKQSCSMWFWLWLYWYTWEHTSTQRKYLILVKGATLKSKTAAMNNFSLRNLWKSPANSLKISTMFLSNSPWFLIQLTFFQLSFE